MLKFAGNAIISCGAWNAPRENPYPNMKPWKDETTGAARWILDATGEDFLDDNGVMYKIRLRTAAELTAAAAKDAPANEVKRLHDAFAEMESHGIMTLDNKGAAEITHTLNSKWYAVSVTPLNGAMPDIHVTCQKNSFEIKGGANNGRITYAVMLVMPPKGRENLILTDPY